MNIGTSIEIGKAIKALKQEGIATPPDSIAQALTSGDMVADGEAALALLCKVRDALKLEADSSDYHRVSLLTDRFGEFVARRCHSATDPRSETAL
jgi:hypothetical protein